MSTDENRLHTIPHSKPRKLAGSWQWMLCGSVMESRSLDGCTGWADFFAGTQELAKAAGLGAVWFKGRRAGIWTLQAFKQMWFVNGVLARVNGDEQQP